MATFEDGKTKTEAKLEDDGEAKMEPKHESEDEEKVEWSAEDEANWREFKSNPALERQDTFDNWVQNLQERENELEAKAAQEELGKKMRKMAHKEMIQRAIGHNIAED